MNWLAFSVTYAVIGLFVVGFMWPNEDEMDEEDYAQLNAATFIIGVAIWPLLVGVYFSDKK